jgi:hypothetical protein
MVDSANRQHFLDAGADEVVCADDLSQGLFLQAIRNPGVSHFMQEILTVTERNDVHAIEVQRSSGLLGKTFDELLTMLRGYSILLLAINAAPHTKNNASKWPSDVEMVEAVKRETGLSEVVFTNPLGATERNYQVREGDLLIVLAESDREIERVLKRVERIARERKGGSIDS